MNLILTPPEIFEKNVMLGVTKSNMPFHRLMLLSIIAGGYCACGAMTCMMVGGTLNEAPTGSAPNQGMFRLIFGSFGFPFGFMSIVVWCAPARVGNGVPLRG